MPVGPLWVCTIDGIPRGVSQARRLDLVPDHVVEVVKLMIGETILSGDVIVEPHVDAGVNQLTEEIAELEARHRRVASDLAQRRRQIVREAPGPRPSRS
jgi:hypothetical protein